MSLVEKLAETLTALTTKPSTDEDFATTAALIRANTTALVAAHDHLAAQQLSRTTYRTDSTGITMAPTNRLVDPRVTWVLYLPDQRTPVIFTRVLAGSTLATINQEYLLIPEPDTGHLAGLTALAESLRAADGGHEDDHTAYIPVSLNPDDAPAMSS